MSALSTILDNVLSFVDHLMCGSFAMGDRDIRDMFGDRLTENIQGSAVDYANHSVDDDNQNH